MADPRLHRIDVERNGLAELEPALRRPTIAATERPDSNQRWAMQNSTKQSRSRRGYQGALADEPGLTRRNPDGGVMMAASKI